MMVVVRVAVELRSTVVVFVTMLYTKKISNVPLKCKLRYVEVMDVLRGLAKKKNICLPLYQQ